MAMDIGESSTPNNSWKVLCDALTFAHETWGEDKVWWPVTPVVAEDSVSLQLQLLQFFCPYLQWNNDSLLLSLNEDAERTYSKRLWKGTWNEIPFNFIQLDRTGMHETLQASITCTYCINISTWCSGSPKGMDFLTKFWNKDEIIIRLLRYVMSVCGQHTWCFHFKHAKYVWRIIEIFIG